MTASVLVRASDPDEALAVVDAAHLNRVEFSDDRLLVVAWSSQDAEPVEPLGDLTECGTCGGLVDAAGAHLYRPAPEHNRARVRPTGPA
jgi:hypothetical protein